jgi:hypothetical protein
MVNGAARGEKKQMGLFDVPILLGFAWVCPNCKETKANRDVIQGGGYMPSCKLCKKNVIPCHIYKDHIEGMEDKTAPENSAPAKSESDQQKKEK